jgi:hypothetical protein
MEFGIELGDSREVGGADRARRVTARAHRVLKLRDRGFFEIEFRRPLCALGDNSRRNGTSDDRRRERRRAHMKERAATEAVRHPMLPVGGKMHPIM